MRLFLWSFNELFTSRRLTWLRTLHSSLNRACEFGAANSKAGSLRLLMQYPFALGNRKEALQKTKPLLFSSLLYGCLFISKITRVIGSRF